MKGFASKRSITIAERVVAWGSDRTLRREQLPESFYFRWLLKGFASKRSITIAERVVPWSSDRTLRREQLPESFYFRWVLKGFASKLQNAQRELKMRPHVDSMPSLETKVSGANPGNAFQNRSVSVGF